MIISLEESASQVTDSSSSLEGGAEQVHQASQEGNLQEYVFVPPSHVLVSTHAACFCLPAKLFSAYNPLEWKMPGISNIHTWILLLCFRGLYFSYKISDWNFNWLCHVKQECTKVLMWFFNIISINKSCFWVLFFYKSTHILKFRLLNIASSCFWLQSLFFQVTEL